ncbi:MAG: tRNA (guanosine(46)-N7)-methyltransferase TrmB [Granulosicoccus sp.]
MVDADRQTASQSPVEAPYTSDIQSPDQAGMRLTKRSIRSFVIRNGRLTAAQNDALDSLLPKFGIAFQSGPIVPEDHFGRKADLWLEIGFGNGDALLNTAEANPSINFLGVEVHAPGVGHALIGIKQRALSNVRIIQHDAMEVLEQMLSPASLARVLLLFPDPWHKKRHHKRRIVQADFLDAVAAGLCSNGVLHCATDWEDYALWIQSLLDHDTRFSNSASAGEFASRPDYRCLTRFERRGQRLGHSVYDLLYTRLAKAPGSELV